MMMHNLGFSGFVMLAVMAIVLVVPFWLLLPKFGISKWVSVLAIIPMVPLVLLWIIAFMEPKASRNSMPEAQT